MTIPNVLTVAGSDPSGGAGIQADMKTFTAAGCFATSVVTALTAQNTRGVTGVLPIPADFVDEQLTTLLDDVRIDAVKIGMLGSAEVARVVARHLREGLAGVPVVLDPVMVSTSGDSLAAEGVQEAITELLPLATLVTPNLPEAAQLTGTAQAGGLGAMEAQGRALVGMGARAALVKGGHLPGEGPLTDLLVTAENVQKFTGRRVVTRNTHGTGCTLSSALACGLAQAGDDPEALAKAVWQAREWLTRALEDAGQLQVGSGEGHGPLNHLAPWTPRT
ncbi:bifunctional hydroxymethylpyrimidine kinase/phosphomethylpyrimidine kinase [Luteococcus sp.]|uniref:bifunctional hydroxymethylpyrimidine kinase/phosphomethylpyrimidine kinase n=1 Tax=Luteococcus sp. TaxID=1969402 RepID=UPI0037360CC2